MLSVVEILCFFFNIEFYFRWFGFFVVNFIEWGGGRGNVLIILIGIIYIMLVLIKLIWKMCLGKFLV